MQRHDFLEIIKSHFSPLFLAIEMNYGQPFTRLPSITFPEDEYLRQILQTELWEHALTFESYDAYHTLALYTDVDILGNILEMAVLHHQQNAILPLIACMERNHQSVAIGLIDCHEKKCRQCSYIRDQIVSFFPFSNCWTLVRSKLREARKRNIYTMWKPYLLTNPQTDAITRKIFKTTSKRWTQVLAICHMVTLWKRWLRYQLSPESRYVNHVLAKRFKERMNLETCILVP